MRTIQRFSVLALVIAVTASVGGCAMKWGCDGFCMKPLFKVSVKLNRYENDDCCHGGSCSGDGGMIEGGVIEGGMINGGFAHAGPLTVETEPLHGYPQLPGNGTAVADASLSSQPGANPAPVFGPNYGKQSATPGSSTGSESQQNAKKRPGSLGISTGLPVGQSNVLRVGQQIVFGTSIENQGDAPLEAFQLQGVFTSNLKPISVIRRSGPTFPEVRTATSSARIEGNRVIFDRFTSLGPDAKHEYQITVEVTGAGAGNFEVTQIEGPVVKKNTSITATAQ